MFVDTLERVCRQLLGDPKPSDGCTPADVRRAEASLGVSLPTPLRVYYLRYGENKVPANARDLLFAPEVLEVDDGHLVFWQENQAVYLAGVPLAALGQDDPPVFQRGTEEDAEWPPECRGLADFLLRTVCWQATWGMPSQARADRVRPAVFARVAAGFPLVAPREPYEHDLIAYAREGVVACTFPSSGALYVGAVSDGGIERVSRELGIGLSILRRARIGERGLSITSAFCGRYLGCGVTGAGRRLLASHGVGLSLPRPGGHPRRGRPPGGLL